MDTEERQFPLWLRAALPLLLALVIGFSAYPLQITQTLQSIEFARAQNDPAAEARNLAQLAAWQPWRPGLWEEAGMKALRGGEPENAITFLFRAQSARGLSTAGYLALAEAYERGGQIQAAEQVWLGLAARSQAGAGEYEKLTRLYWQRGELEKALPTARMWVQLAPNNAQANYWLGLLLLEGKPAEGIKLLFSAKNLDGGLASRVDALDTAWQLSQKEPQAGYQAVVLGRALANLGYWPLAERLFARGTVLAPDYAEAWAFLGEARQQLGGEGYAELEKARAFNPQSVVTRALIALYYRRQGRFEESLALLKAVAMQEPKQPIWQIELGNTMVEMKDISAALDYYQAAAKINPTDAVYWQLLAEFCAVHQVALREVGLPAARQALALTPAEPSALDVMGQVMAGLEDLASAERFLKQALEVDETFAAAHFHLGQIYLQQSLLPLARTHLTAAYQYAQENSEVRLLAQRLLERFFGAQP